MPDTIRQDIEIQVSASVDESLNRLSKSIGKITEDTNRMGAAVIGNFTNMGRQLENATRSLNFGATLQGYFSSITKSSAAAFGEVKSHLQLMEKALGKLPGITKEKAEVKINLDQVKMELGQVNEKIKETEKLIKQLQTKSGSIGSVKGATSAFSTLDESMLLKSNLQKEKKAWQDYYTEVKTKQQGILSEVYTKTGELSNSVVTQLGVNAKKVSAMIKDVADSQVASLSRMQKVSGTFGGDTKNILVNKSILDSTRREYTELNTFVIGLEKSLSEAIKVEQVARAAYDKQYVGEAKERNKQLWESTLFNLEKITSEYKSASAALEKLQKGIAEGNVQQKSNIAKVQKDYAKGGLKYVMGFDVNELETELASSQTAIKGLYDRMQKISKDYSKGAVEEGKKIREEFKDIQGKFNARKEEITKVIMNLRSLTKGGMINATPDILALEGLAKKYTETANSIKTDAISLGKLTTAQGQQAAKGFFTRFWEGFRDLRWQIAAAAYMMNMFVNTIVRRFDEALSKISEFNKEVFGLASTIGLAMGKFAPQFNTVFEYSAEVMTKLQAAAAGTYLKMEDLQMVVRTFAMHGMFPKSDQDIKSLVTIASGVKILTEGMANEGVQMRQEIDALLSGRQRVTDTLARTFKNAGIDIKEEMRKWQAEGMSAMQGLARALQPIANMNEKIADQYAAQKNLLQSNYEYIQRTYLTGLHDAVGSFLADVNKSLGKPGEFIGETGKAIGELLVIWNTSLSILFAELINMVKTVLDNFYILSEVLGGQSGFKGGLEFALKTVYLLSHGFNTIVATVTFLASQLMGIGRIILGVATTDLVLFNQGVKNVINSATSYFDIMTTQTERFIDNWDNAGKLVDQIVSKINLSTNKVQSMKKFIDVSEAITGLQHLDVELGKISDKYKPKEEKIEDVIKNIWEGYGASLVAVNKALWDLQKEEKKIFEAMKDDSIQTTKGVMEEMASLVNEFKGKIATSGIGGIQLESGRSLIRRPVPGASGGMASLEGERDIYGLAESNVKKREYLTNKLKETTEKALKAQEDALSRVTNKGKTAIDMWDEYIGLMERLNALDPFTKLELHYQKFYADIEKMAQDNKYVVDNINKLKLQADKWYATESLKIYYDYVDKQKDIMRKMSAATETVFEKINEEIDNLIRNAEREFFWNPQKVEELKKWGELHRAIRTARAELEQLREIANEQLNVAGLASDLLSKSSTPGGKQMGELLKLQVDYNKNIVDSADKIKTFGDKWGYGTDKFKEYVSTVQEGLKLQEMLMEYQKERVMNPFFADLEGMTQGWIDSMSDGIADIMMDFSKAGETLKRIFNDITKQVLSSFVKRQLIEPLVNKSGGGMGMFGGVFNVNNNTIQSQTAKYMEQMQKMQGSNQQYLADAIAGKFGPTALGTISNPMWVQIAGSGLGVGTGFGGGGTGIPSLVAPSTSATPNMIGNYDWTSRLASTEYSKSFQDMMKQPWFQTAIEQSYAKGLDPALTLSVLKAESASNINALSPKGAGGLMQIMPGTFSGLGYNPADRFNPTMNISAGTDYLSQNLYKYGGDVTKTLAAYNAGPGAVAKYGGVPPYAETQNYIAKVNKNFDTLSQDMQKFNGNLNTGTTDLSDFGKSIDANSKQLISVEGKVKEGNLFGSTATSTSGKLPNTFGSTLGTMNVTAQIVNVSGGIGSGVGTGFGGGGTGLPAKDVFAGSVAKGEVKSTEATLTNSLQGTFSKLTISLSNLFSNLFNNLGSLFSNLFSALSSVFSGGMGSGGSGGGIMSLFGSLFGGSGGGGNAFSGSYATAQAFAKGGLITEPIVGKGMLSGKLYSFGEEGTERVIPDYKVSDDPIREGIRNISTNVFDDMRARRAQERGAYEAGMELGNGPQGNVINKFSFSINAIDTKSGVEFLMQNSDAIQGIMVKSLKNNKAIRGGIRGAY